MTTTYYTIRATEDGTLVGVMAATDQARPGYTHMYLWAPTLGAWVRDDDLYRDFWTVAGERMNAYEEIDDDQALALAREAPTLDRWTLAQLKTQNERLTSADLGLPVDTAQPRPTTDPHTLDSVRKAPLGTWVTVRTFPASGRIAARTWASEVRLGKKKRMAALGPLDVELHPVDEVIEARVRRAVTDDRLVDTARQLAERAHGLQVDKAGQPYIDHPRRVAERLETSAAPAAVVAAGWLHDVLEDTTLTADDLRAAGIPEDTIAAVEAVTKRDGEPAEGYIARIVTTPHALDVKHADLADNTDPARVAMLDAATRQRLADKYARFRSLLADALRDVSTTSGTTA